MSATAQRSTLALYFALVLYSSCAPSFVAAQQSAGQTVPHLTPFSGTVVDSDGQPRSGITGITFALYKEQTGGVPLWLETQNVVADNDGHYTASLGATKAEGLPVELFTSGEARWLGVQPDGQAEQPRVLLLSVPYALKAADAETVGGLPPSAFVLANGAQESGAAKSDGVPASTATPRNSAVTGKGMLDYIPMWDSTSDIVDSLIFQKSSEIGINTTTPAAVLDVNGKSDVRDTLTLFPKSTDPTLAINGTAFKVDQTGKVTFVSGQTFPGTIAGVTTAANSGLQGGGTTGNLNLGVKPAGITNAMLQKSSLTIPVTAPLTGGGTASLGGTATSIALKPCPANQALVSSGTTWSCKTVGGGGSGTVTSIAFSAPSSDFTVSGSPVTSSGTLGLNWKVAPTNAATANAIVKRDSTGSFSAANITSSTVSLSDTSVGQALLAISTPPGAITIYGQASAPTGVGFGIKGDTESGDTGAVGAVGYAGSFSGFATGVEGFAASANGIGVHGVAGDTSVQGAGFGSAGLWGDVATTGDVVSAVLATADDGYGLAAYNNSASDFPTAYIESAESTNSDFPVMAISSSGFGGECIIDVTGNLFCTGSKSAVVPVDGGARKVALYAIEGPENWFEDAGGGQLLRGAALVQLEPTFAQTVNTGVEYRVFLTPNGDCKGLYVSQKSPTSFEVRELGGGTSNIAFDYRIIAKRKGYENIRLADKTKALEFPKRPFSRTPATAKPALLRSPGAPVSKVTTKRQP